MAAPVAGAATPHHVDDTAAAVGLRLEPGDAERLAAP